MLVGDEIGDVSVYLMHNVPAISTNQVSCLYTTIRHLSNLGRMSTRGGGVGWVRYVYVL